MFPITMGIILTMIYLLLYQYDRCILEQNAGRLALWGGTAEMDSSDAELAEKEIAVKSAEICEDIYVAWRQTEKKAAMKRNEFTVTDSGGILFPFGSWREDFWSMTATYSFDRMDAADFVRLCNRLAQDE